MSVTPQTLKEIADKVLENLRQLPADEMKAIVNMGDYHGFLKSRLPEEFLSSILSPFNLTSKDVQIEVVEVATDLTHEVHYHEHSFAYCVCMGEEYHVKAPEKAKAYLVDHWAPVQDKDIVEIPAGTPHGFTIEEGGTLTFLSVQAPPIVHDNHDDYIRIKVQ